MKILISLLFVLTFSLFQLPSTAEAQVTRKTKEAQPLRPASEQGESTMDSLFCGPCIFFIPKVFTPKIDQVQSGWRLKPLCDHTIHSFNLEVYNRWGEFFFEANDITEYWNGKDKGEFVKPGTYVYKISIEVQSNDKIIPAYKTGQVNINTPISDQ